MGLPSRISICYLGLYCKIEYVHEGKRMDNLRANGREQKAVPPLTGVVAVAGVM
jgi:hypothetical protein